MYGLKYFIGFFSSNVHKGIFSPIQEMLISFNTTLTSHLIDYTAAIQAEFLIPNYPYCVYPVHTDKHIARYTTRNTGAKYKLRSSNSQEMPFGLHVSTLSSIISDKAIAEPEESLRSRYTATGLSLGIAANKIGLSLHLSRCETGV